MLFNVSSKPDKLLVTIEIFILNKKKKKQTENKKKNLSLRKTFLSENNCLLMTCQLDKSFLTEKVAISMGKLQLSAKTTHVPTIINIKIKVSHIICQRPHWFRKTLFPFSSHYWNITKSIYAGTPFYERSLIVYIACYFSKWALNTFLNVRDVEFIKTRLKRYKYPDDYNI